MALLTKHALLNLALINMRLPIWLCDCVRLADLWQDLWQPCVQPPCPTYTWSYSDWVCNNTLGCGGGVANRTATCVQAGTKKTVANSYCDRDTYDNSTQLCAQNPCHVYYWRTRELGDCLPEDPSKPCGRVSDCLALCIHTASARWCTEHAVHATGATEADARIASCCLPLMPAICALARCAYLTEDAATCCAAACCSSCSTCNEGGLIVST